MSIYQNILVTKEAKTAILTISREEKLNALNAQTLIEISDALDELNRDNDIRGIILTGKEEKAFVAGADIKEFVDLNVEEAQKLSRNGQKNVFDKIHHFRKPVIAAINGFALGGGLELALACHMRVALESAKMGLPEVSLGVIPGYGGTQRLPQLVGRGKALEMILTGEMIDAQDAIRWGLVNHVVATQEDLLLKAKSILDKIYTRSSTAIAVAIQAVNVGVENPAKGYEKEIELFGACFDSSDKKEGVSAFLEKRKPNF